GPDALGCPVRVGAWATRPTPASAAFSTINPARPRRIQRVYAIFHTSLTVQWVPNASAADQPPGGDGQCACACGRGAARRRDRGGSDRNLLRAGRRSTVGAGCPQAVCAERAWTRSAVSAYRR